MMVSYSAHGYQSLPFATPVNSTLYQPGVATATQGQNNMITNLVQYQNIKNAMLPLSPKIFHPPHKPCQISIVDKMTVNETAQWIWTLAEWFGWSEGRAYCKSFKDNAICGRMLKNLTRELLEFDLGITSLVHRQEILSAIKSLFPAQFSKAPPVRRPSISSIAECSTYGGIRHIPGSENESTTGQYPISVYSSQESLHLDTCDYMSDSCNSRSSVRTGTSEDKTLSRWSSGRPTYPRSFGGSRLHLLCDANTVRDINVIRNRFCDFNFFVNVRPSGDHYIVSFQNCVQAKHALHLAKEIGYRLAIRPRATPSCPATYVCMSRCTIREGKSLNGNVVGNLSKGEKVTVNQLKGRRARLIELNEYGEVQKRGWVTVTTKDGVELLKRLDDE